MKVYKYILFFSLNVSIGVLGQETVFTSDTGLIRNSEVLFMKNTSKFHEPFYSALEKFPELTNSQIEIKRKHIYTMMAARPGRGFFFQPRNKRRYVILITDKSDMNADSIYSKVDQEAIVGLFGHELSHLLDYQKKTNFQMIFFGIGYYFNRKKIEHKTDLVAIERGFGDNLIKYNQFIYTTKYANKHYLSQKRKYYLSQSDIKSTIEKKEL